MSTQLDVLSQVSPSCRTVEWISAVRQVISFGHRSCRNHGRYCCRIQVSGGAGCQGTPTSLSRSSTFALSCSGLRLTLSSSHDTKDGASVELRAPLDDPEEQSIAPTFWESTCSLASGDTEDGLGEDREQFSECSPFQSLMRCQPIGSDLSVRDLAGSVKNEPKQHRVLRTDVFLVQLAQRHSDRARHTLYCTDRHLGQPVVL